MDQVSFHFCVLRAPAARAKKTWWCRKMRCAHFSTPPCHVFRRGSVARRHARRAHHHVFLARPSHARSTPPCLFDECRHARRAHHHVMFSGAAQSRAVTPGEHTPCHVFRRGPVARRHARRAHHHVMFSGAAQSRGGSHHHVFLARPSRARSTPPCLFDECRHAGEHTTMPFWRGPVARGANQRR